MSNIVVSDEPKRTSDSMQRSENTTQPCGHPDACVKTDPDTHEVYCAWCKDRENDLATITLLRDDMDELQGWGRSTLRLKGTVAVFRTTRRN